MIRHPAFVVAILTSLAGNGAFAADVDFAKQIQPIFTEHCVGCHGEKKRSGKLRLHNVESIQEKLAVDDHLLVAGNPDESELYERISLPADHKKRMPKKADPLPEEKIELIRLWIEQGAVLAAVGKLAPEEHGKPEYPAAEQPPAELPLPEVAPADPAAIDRVVKAGSQIMNLYADCPLLQISYALRSEPAPSSLVASCLPPASSMANTASSGEPSAAALTTKLCTVPFLAVSAKRSSSPGESMRPFIAHPSETG